jgi:hypothetical protein
LPVLPLKMATTIFKNINGIPQINSGGISILDSRIVQFGDSVQSRELMIVVFDGWLDISHLVLFNGYF